jgi:hypothetical protein
MFVEVNAKLVNETWTINVKAIAFFLPYNDGTRIYFINDSEPLDVSESYNEFKKKVNGALVEYKEHYI